MRERDGVLVRDIIYEPAISTITAGRKLFLLIQYCLHHIGQNTIATTATLCLILQAGHVFVSFPTLGDIYGTAIRVIVFVPPGGTLISLLCSHICTYREYTVSYFINPFPIRQYGLFFINHSSARYECRDIFGAVVTISMGGTQLSLLQSWVHYYGWYTVAIDEIICLIQQTCWLFSRCYFMVDTELLLQLKILSLLWHVGHHLCWCDPVSVLTGEKKWSPPGYHVQCVVWNNYLPNTPPKEIYTDLKSETF